MSVLLPVLFLVYLNEISKNIKYFTSLSVDDTVLKYFTSLSVDDTILSYSSKFFYNLHNVVLSDLNTLQSRAELWNVSFNASTLLHELIGTASTKCKKSQFR